MKNMTNQNNELIVFWQSQKIIFLHFHYHSNYGTKIHKLTGKIVSLINNIIDIYYKMINSNNSNLLEMYKFRLKIIQNEIREMNNQFGELQNEPVVE